MILYMESVFTVAHIFIFWRFSMKKRLFALFSAIVIVAAVFTGTVTASADDSGTCGSSAVWTYEETTQKLTISGSGEMFDYAKVDDVPWHGLSITQVYVTQNVSSVGKNAFADLPELASVSLNSTVLSVDPTAFLDCPELNNFIVDLNNPKYTVMANKGLVEDGIKLVKYASKCSATVTLPATLKIIGDYAFYGCTLNTIEFGSGVEIIGDYAFAGCNISKITFPDNVRSIGAYAFAGTSLTELNLTMQINSVGNNAFENCASLKTLTVGNPVTDFGTGAFSGCSAIDSFTYYGDTATWSTINAGNRVIAKSPSMQNRYVICYDANGGLGAPANIEGLTSGTMISTVKPVSLDKELAFKGWTLSKGSATADYTGGDSYGKTTSSHLYAMWGTQVYSVTYNANGGSGAPEAAVYSTPQNHTVTNAVPTKSGWQFDGWALKKDAVSGTYHSGDVIKVDGEITLYAIWVDNGPYTVNFSAAGADSGTVPDKIIKIKGEDLIIPSTEPQKDRYTFNYWYCNVDGQKYYPGSTFKLDKNATLIARWVFNGPCEIVFSPSNDIDADTAPVTYTIGATLTIPAAPTAKQDHEFVYWEDNYEDSDGGYHNKTYAPGDTYKADHDAKITAVWKKINYTAATSLSLSETVETSAGYKNKVHITATAANLPEGYSIAIYKSDSKLPINTVVSTGGTTTLEYTSDELTSNASFTVKVLDKDGKDCKNSANRPLRSNITVKVNQSFFQKIIALFRSIFGGQRTVEIY